MVTGPVIQYPATSSMVRSAKRVGSSQAPIRCRVVMVRRWNGIRVGLRSGGQGWARIAMGQRYGFGS